MPPWVTQFLNEGRLSLSINEAVNAARTFLLECAQPLTEAQLQQGADANHR